MSEAVSIFIVDFIINQTYLCGGHSNYMSKPIPGTILDGPYSRRKYTEPLCAWSILKPSIIPLTVEGRYCPIKETFLY